MDTSHKCNELAGSSWNPQTSGTHLYRSMLLSTPLYTEFFFSLEHTAFAGRIKPACRSPSELRSPGDQKWIAAGSTRELWIQHEGMCWGPLHRAGQEMVSITWHVYPALIPVGLRPLQYPRRPPGRLTLPLPLVQRNWKGVWERREEGEEGISCSQYCWTPELSKWPKRRLILLMCKA